MTADGVDVSVVGKVDENELMKKSPKRLKKDNKKSLSSSTSSGSVSSTSKASTRISKIRGSKASVSFLSTDTKSVATRRSNRSKTPTLSAGSSMSSPKGIDINSSDFDFCF